jgi:hypothetical protein
MEVLRWWLLFLVAVMFSMSGCASVEDWATWSTHPSHFASGEHLAFSMKSHRTDASITDADIQAAMREEWWGRYVPEANEAPQAALQPTAQGTLETAMAPAPDAPSRLTPPPMVVEQMPQQMAQPMPQPAAPAPATEDDLTGRWRGTWVSRGLFGDERVSDVDATFSQYGKRGSGRIALVDSVAAVGVPSRLREAGSFGVPVFFKVSGDDMVARDKNGSSLKFKFTRIGDRLYGRIVDSPAPVILVLERQPR